MEKTVYLNEIIEKTLNKVVKVMSSRFCPHLDLVYFF